MGTINATCELIHKKELKLQKLNYLKYRADGLYDSQNEKNNSSWDRDCCPWGIEIILL
jgi:hypothetical protein